MLNVMTVDDRDRTPNFGKQLANPSTLLATPPLTIVGIRGYRVDYNGRHALFDIVSRDTIRDQKKRLNKAPWKRRCVKRKVISMMLVL